MSLYLDDGDVRLYHGDALSVLQTLEAESVHMCVTSPPFYGLRDYGTGRWEGGNPDCDHRQFSYPRERETPGGRGGSMPMSETVYKDVCGKCGARRVDQQIGLEATPEQWVDALVQVFREVKRVLRDDGTLWLEVGDSYNSRLDGSHGGWNGSTPEPQRVKNEGATGVARTLRTVKPKDLIGAPWMLAEALKAPYYTGEIRDERDRLWLAAMIDTEGCIDINRLRVNGERKRESFGTYVRVHNTSERLVRRCAEIAGAGSVKVHDERRRPVYVWAVYGENAHRVLREVYPHLVAKQHEARLALAPSDETCSGLRLLHAGSETSIDRTAPESLFEPGWYLRSDIVWARPNPMPESVTDRPTKSHSYVFLLAKQPRYFFDAEAVRERYDSNSYERTLNPAHGFGAGVGDSSRSTVHAIGNHNPAGRNVRSVWNIATQPFPDAHFATFPEELARRCILAGTSERGCCPDCGAPWRREMEYGEYVKTGASGNVRPSTSGEEDQGRRRARDGHVSGMQRLGTLLGWQPSCGHDGEPTPCTVLDPFVGSGTVPYVARKHGRHAIGIDLSSSYLELAARRLQQLSLFA